MLGSALFHVLEGDLLLLPRMRKDCVLRNTIGKVLELDMLCIEEPHASEHTRGWAGDMIVKKNTIVNWMLGMLHGVSVTSNYVADCVGAKEM